MRRWRRMGEVGVGAQRASNALHPQPEKEMTVAAARGLRRRGT
jgi:hypothetical protein